MTPRPSIKCIVEDHIALLTIDNPRRKNALTLEMVRELDSLTRACQADTDVRCVVITGAGHDAFCSGGDLETLLPATVNAGIDIVNPDPGRRFFSDVYKPVVAAVRGACVGGGLEILLGTDIRVAGEGSVFGVPEVKWGLIPGAGTHIRLPRQIGWANAMHLLLTGELISEHRASEIGLIGEIVPADQVLDRAMSIARVITANAPLAVQTAKEIAVRALDLEAGFRLEHELNSRVLSSADAKEGPAAFIAKRSPNYTGG